MDILKKFEKKLTGTVKKAVNGESVEYICICSDTILIITSNPETGDCREISVDISEVELRVGGIGFNEDVLSYISGLIMGMDWEISNDAFSGLLKLNGGCIEYFPEDEWPELEALGIDSSQVYEEDTVYDFNEWMEELDDYDEECDGDPFVCALADHLGLDPESFNLM